ncbi:3',5'-cyclic-AMP phosphodiesterase [Alginatibacterium sediminis]|uniref:3',5'-cyclic adenosine monophosphate phosphodiesterase CpdA n=1 Tax=Alginatibacterium sediminis TaxID=2164068 RepID=A0A420ECU9_9ALTE|nr:3',5'-cyclic-AMP phosphodiesterase [Alginatibacterium sediminis]RKF18452.1 3',5'-cyclic-AMP phosphodiesterase [Alginatibacterium sediminis]
MAFEQFELACADNGDIRLLQVTDTHLFAKDEHNLLGINTSDSYQRVVEEIRHSQQSYDWVLATGDLSQDHSKDSYRRFANITRQLEKPCFWLPGNHDFRPHTTALSESGIIDAKHLISEHWQIIMLDTQVTGKPMGLLSSEQLEGLATALQQYPEKSVLICMHHQAVPVGSRWLDQHNLKNADEFFQVVAGCSKVRAVLFGHVHQNFEMEHRGIAFMASPSTCIQFLPLSAHFALDHQQPGWRYITLKSDGTISTRVCRLAERTFLPDPDSKGY